MALGEVKLKEELSFGVNSISHITVGEMVFIL